MNRGVRLPNPRPHPAHPFGASLLPLSLHYAVHPRHCQVRTSTSTSTSATVKLANKQTNKRLSRSKYQNRSIGQQTETMSITENTPNKRARQSNTIHITSQYPPPTERHVYQLLTKENNIKDPGPLREKSLTRHRRAFFTSIQPSPVRKSRPPPPLTPPTPPPPASRPATSSSIAPVDDL